VKPLKATEFPALRRVFSGYLHEDFLDEYTTPEAALQGFLEDADAAERLRFRTEARRFLERTAELGIEDLRALIARLGCRWVPPSREALVAALSAAAKPTDEITRRDL
jgi:hypothetical protein